MNWFVFLQILFILDDMFTIVELLAHGWSHPPLRSPFPNLEDGFPPFDPGALPAERDVCRRFNLTDPVSKV